MEIVFYIFWGVIAVIILAAVTIVVIRHDRKNSSKKLSEDIAESRAVYKNSTADDLDVDIRLMIQYGKKYDKYKSIHSLLFLKIKQLEKRIDSMEKADGN